MQEWIAAQGGDVRCILQPELLPQAACSRAVPAARSGYIAAMDAEQIGVASMLLGAGRAKKGDPIDPAAGICLHKKTGQPVEAGEPLCTLYTNRPETLEAAAAAYTAAITIGAQPPVEQPLIYDTVR